MFARALYLAMAFGVTYFWSFITNAVKAIVTPLWAGLEGALDFIPRFNIPGGLADALGLANYFLPIVDMAYMIIAYWLFVAAFASVKIVIKMIPTVG